MYATPFITALTAAFPAKQHKIQVALETFSAKVNKLTGSQVGEQQLMDIFGPSELAKRDEGGAEDKVRNEKEVRTGLDPECKYIWHGYANKPSHTSFCIANVSITHSQADNASRRHSKDAIGGSKVSHINSNIQKFEQKDQDA